MTTPASMPPNTDGQYVGMYGGSERLARVLRWHNGKWCNLHDDSSAVFGPACGPDGSEDTWREVTPADKFDEYGRIIK